MHFDGLPSFSLGSYPKQGKNMSEPESEKIMEINQFYDRYFFSTIPSKSSDWNKRDTLPNTKIIYAPGNEIDNTSNSQSASHLLVRDGFNLNSVSKNAWKAVLSAVNIKDYKYTQQISYNEYNKQADLNTQEAILDSVKYAFFSFPFNANQFLEAPNAPEEDRYRYISPANTLAFSENIMLKVNHESFLQGFRELNDDQLDLLASAIVEHIKNKTTEMGRPFLSVSEFLNSGVLKYAIDDVKEINTPSGASKSIPNNSPAALTQSVIMNTLSPYLFSRSDTFTIRAYGKTESSPSAYTSTYCEATVQRTPELINETLGRKFKITSFRWLSPDDI
jgi:hypothetical protein